MQGKINLIHKARLSNKIVTCSFDTSGNWVSLLDSQQINSIQIRRILIGKTKGQEAKTISRRSSTYINKFQRGSTVQTKPTDNLRKLEKKKISDLKTPTKLWNCKIISEKRQIVSSKPSTLLLTHIHATIKFADFFFF